MEALFTVLRRATEPAEGIIPTLGCVVCACRGVGPSIAVAIPRMNKRSCIARNVVSYIVGKTGICIVDDSAAC